MGCQKNIAKQIVQAEGDHVLALKGNQSNLSEQVEAVFEQANAVGYEGYDVDYYETKEPSRDRYEVRRHWILSVTDTQINTQPCEGNHYHQFLHAGENTQPASWLTRR